MRRPSTISPPVGRFADVLLSIDLPDLPDERRAQVTEFIEQRVSTLPSFTRFGVVVISFTVDLVSRVIGLDRAAALVTAKPLPLLAEYPRLVRSLGYAFIWETWPDTRPTGAAA
jgi:hypothetical protein